MVSYNIFMIKHTRASRCETSMAWASDSLPYPDPLLLSSTSTPLTLFNCISSMVLYHWFHTRFEYVYSAIEGH